MNMTKHGDRCVIVPEVSKGKQMLTKRLHLTFLFKLPLPLCTRRIWSLFLSGEGPRSRRYGRTAALRLLVQPYDGDNYFLSFSK
jgi:hypothetical protein